MKYIIGLIIGSILSWFLLQDAPAYIYAVLIGLWCLMIENKDQQEKTREAIAAASRREY